MTMSLQHNGDGGMFICFDMLIESLDRNEFLKLMEINA